MKVVLVGGGTAGHVNPAVAIAEEILKREPNSQVLFIGREGGREMRAVERAGIKSLSLRVRGLSRKLFGGNIKTVLMALAAERRAAKIIKSVGAELVIATGGYVSWPVLRAAQKLRIKTVIHESNAAPGLVTKLMAKKCDRVLLGYKKAALSLPKKAKISTVGNPLRKDFGFISRQKARNELKISPNEILIVSFGGSGGARELNYAILEVMKEICEKDKRIFHIHAVGDRFFGELTEEDMPKSSGRIRVVPYIEDMPTVLSAADIAITRAGALTLAELAFTGVAAILVPSPNVTANHQYENAKVICQEGGAILCEEGEDLKERLSETLLTLIEDKGKRQSLSAKIKRFSPRGAEERIYEELKKL